MKLSFVIDKDYLIVHTLIHTGKHSFSQTKYLKDIVAFQDYAWSLSKDLYNSLPGRQREDIFAQLNGFASYKRLIARLPAYFAKLKQSKEFRKLYQQTNRYKKFCEREWNQAYRKASGIVQDITQFSLNKSFTVLLTHPSQMNGSSIGDNRIVWGHAEDWKRYTVVYLWHEVLHSYLEHSEVNHAIIELIADGELRYRLTGVKYPPFVGHDYLKPLEKKIFPYWRKYLKSKTKNFSEFQALLSKLKL